MRFRAPRFKVFQAFSALQILIKILDCIVYFLSLLLLAVIIIGAYLLIKY